MKRRRLRVLHVVHELHYGGLECLVAEMVRLIDHDRFESHILTLSNFGRFADGLEPFAQLHRFRSVPRLSMLLPRGLIRKIRAIPITIALFSPKGTPLRCFTRLGRRTGLCL